MSDLADCEDFEMSRTCIKEWAASIALSIALFGGTAGGASAMEWSDTSIGWRYGTKFREPFIDEDIHKNIVNLQHASGYKYGTNFFNADLLMSDKHDPGNNSEGAQEAYIVYRNTIDIGKVFDREFKYGGVVRGFGATLGFDLNTKNDASYSSKKRMLVVGPTLMIDVPGFLNIGLYELFESNAPIGITSRYNYDPHPMLDFTWGIPIGGSPFVWQGYLDFAASKGKDEFGGDTAPETHMDTQIMLDVGRVLGGPKDTFKIGLEYEYWENKYGNNHKGAAGDSAFAKTPMIRAEYHF
jgi:nucleoside-specific outer membrane channel protein Tsx